MNEIWKYNESICGTYTQIKEQLDRYFEGRFDPDRVFWIAVCDEIVKLQPNCQGCYNDFVGMLMNSMKNNNSGCTEFLEIVRQSDPEYAHMGAELELGCDPMQYGAYHRWTIKQNPDSIILLMQACLLFYQEIVPYVYKCMVSWNAEYGKPEFGIGLETAEKTKRNYNRYRAYWKKTMDCLEIVEKVVHILH